MRPATAVRSQVALGLYRQGWSLTAIGDLLGVTREAVRQWVRAAGEVPARQRAREWRAAAVCAVTGCDRQAKVREWCKLHYGRWQRHGDPTVVLVKSPAQHGTRSKYVAGCRCEECRAAHRERQIEDNRRRQGSPRTPHGTASGYINWGCRCQPCREAEERRLADNPRRCEVAGCGQPHVARGLCRRHWEREYAQRKAG